MAERIDRVIGGPEVPDDMESCGALSETLASKASAASARASTVAHLFDVAQHDSVSTRHAPQGATPRHDGEPARGRRQRERGGKLE